METYVRAGFDLTFGSLGRGELMSCDPVSGQRYRTVANEWSGLSVVLGADFAYVGSSVYFPETRGPSVSKNTRTCSIGHSLARRERSSLVLWDDVAWRRVRRPRWWTSNWACTTQL